MQYLAQINWWAVLVATVAGYFLGYLYYLPPVFGNLFIKLILAKKKPEDMGNPATAMIISPLLILVMSFTLALLIVALNITDALMGMTVGILAGVGIVITNMLLDSLYNGESFKLWALGAGYKIIMFAAMGAILGAWR